MIGAKRRISTGALERYDDLLRGSGIRIQADMYLKVKRHLSYLVIGCWMVLIVSRHSGWFSDSIVYRFSAIGLLLISIFMLLDATMLEALKARRSKVVMKEIYYVCHQLLYYAHANLNLHAKLLRCQPFTRVMRADFEMMLNEWYEDGQLAVDRFNQRLGTDEGHGFAETLQSLRSNESEQYYELLRQRIADYKEKLELAKDTKKEAASYILFILAGIPIFYTFRVFLYPWLSEGQKLFDTLQ